MNEKKKKICKTHQKLVFSSELLLSKNMHAVVLSENKCLYAFMKCECCP